MSAYAIVMPIKIGLALELLRARYVPNHGEAWMRVLSLRVVCLQVRLPVVGAFEQFPADLAVVGGFFGSGPPTLLLYASSAWQHRVVDLETRDTTLGAGLKLAHVCYGVFLGPFRMGPVQILCLRRLRSVEVFGLRW